MTSILNHTRWPEHLETILYMLSYLRDSSRCHRSLVVASNQHLPYISWTQVVRMWGKLPGERDVLVTPWWHHGVTMVIGVLYPSLAQSLFYDRVPIYLGTDHNREQATRTLAHIWLTICYRVLGGGGGGGIAVTQSWWKVSWKDVILADNWFHEPKRGQVLLKAKLMARHNMTFHRTIVLWQTAYPNLSRKSDSDTHHITV